MRGGASTVGREIALAEAYLRIVPAGRNKQLTARAHVAEEAADADFPPMVLLPLVHAAAEAGSAQVSIDGSSGPGRTAITVRATCEGVPPAWTGDALHVIRETLLHYLGSDASLTVARDATDAAATVTWPASDASAVAAQRVA
jgi:LytS/YehU family sensor histidine kinase